MWDASTGRSYSGKKIADIDRAVDFIDEPFLNAKLPGEQLENFLRSAGLDLEPDGHFVRAVPDLGLHGLQKIHHLIFVEVVIVVPRDAEGDDVLDLHPGKQPLDVLAYEVFEENEMVPPISSMHGNKPRQDRGYFDEGVSLRHLYSARFLENDHKIEAEVCEERKRMSRIDGKRRQNREDLCLEVFFEPLPLLLIEFVDTVHEYPGFFVVRAAPPP